MPLPSSFRVPRPALGTLLLAWPLLAAAAPTETGDLTALSLESLTSMEVSTASRYAQSASDAPSAVRLIRREDIRRHGWRTLAEALASLPGFQVISDRAYAFGGARGFLVPGDYNTRFLLLVDGLRVNDNVYQQALLGEEFPLDMGLVERIEYVPGPGSSVYGGNAIFGVINVITRKAGTLPPAAAGMTVDSLGGVQASLSGVRRLSSGALLLAAASGGYQPGRDSLYRDPHGTLTDASGLPSPDGRAENRDRSGSRRLLLRYEDGDLTLSGRFGERRVHPSSALYGSLFNDPAQYIEDGSWSLSARYDTTLAPDLTLDAQLELAASTYDSVSAYLDGGGARYLNRDQSEGLWWNGESRVLYTGLDGHKLIAGLGFRHDIRARQQNRDLDGAAVNPAVDIRSPGKSLGIFAQDEWQVRPAWRLNAGLRLDHDPDGDTVLSPRLGLIHPDHGGRTWKLLAGKAWRPANAYERWYGNGINYLANPDLKPETIRTLEAVLEQPLENLGQLTASAWHYTLDGLISQETLPGGSLRYRNLGRIEASGLELAWDGSLESGLDFHLSAAGGHGEDDSGQRTGFSPSWMLKARLSVPVGQAWTVSGEATCLPRTPYDWQGFREALPGHCLLDLSLGGGGRPHGLEYRLRLRNVLDRDIAEPASSEVPAPAIPGQARTLEAGLHYAF